MSPRASAGLAEQVLPLIRTRAELYRWRASNAHGAHMHEAVDILEGSMTSMEPKEVYTVTTKAIASAMKVIARADDSSGIIGDACRRLLAGESGGTVGTAFRAERGDSRRQVSLDRFAYQLGLASPVTSSACGQALA